MDAEITKLAIISGSFILQFDILEISFYSAFYDLNIRQIKYGNAAANLILNGGIWFLVPCIAGMGDFRGFSGKSVRRLRSGPDGIDTLNP